MKLQIMYGFFYICDNCTTWALCWKCYRSRDTLHPRHPFTLLHEEEYEESENEASEHNESEEEFEEAAEESVIDIPDSDGSDEEELDVDIPLHSDDLEDPESDATVDDSDYLSE